jgi:hypothetical protein
LVASFNKHEKITVAPPVRVASVRIAAANKSASAAGEKPKPAQQPKKNPKAKLVQTTAITEEEESDNTAEDNTKPATKPKQKAKKAKPLEVTTISSDEDELLIHQTQFSIGEVAAKVDNVRAVMQKQLDDQYSEMKKQNMAESSQTALETMMQANNPNLVWQAAVDAEDQDYKRKREKRKQKERDNEARTQEKQENEQKKKKAKKAAKKEKKVALAASNQQAHELYQQKMEERLIQATNNNTQNVTYERDQFRNENKALLMGIMGLVNPAGVQQNPFLQAMGQILMPTGTSVGSVGGSPNVVSQFTGPSFTAITNETGPSFTAITNETGHQKKRRSKKQKHSKEKKSKRSGKKSKKRSKKPVSSSDDAVVIAPSVSSVDASPSLVTEMAGPSFTAIKKEAMGHQKKRRSKKQKHSKEKKSKRSGKKSKKRSKKPMSSGDSASSSDDSSSDDSSSSSSSSSSSASQ